MNIKYHGVIGVAKNKKDAMNAAKTYLKRVIKLRKMTGVRTVKTTTRRRMSAEHVSFDNETPSYLAWYCRIKFTCDWPKED